MRRNINKLNDRVEIQRKQAGVDSFGDSVDNWLQIGLPWAGIESTGGGEFNHAGSIMSESTHVITMRETDIKTSDRIVFEKRIFNISSITILENSFLNISASEVIDG